MLSLRLEHGHPHIVGHGKTGDYERMELIKQMQSFFASLTLSEITATEIELYDTNPTIH
jgi:hypothetical protein